MDYNEDSGGGMSDISAIINLTKLCIGVGILALPSSMLEGGLIFAPLGIGLIAMWNGLSCRMILRCKDACIGEVYPIGLSSTYSRISFSALRWPGSIITDVSIILTLLGVCVTYQIGFTDLLSTLPGFSILSKLSWNIIFALLVTPLVMVKDISFLSSFSLGGLIAILISVICIFGFGLELYGKKVLDEHNYLGLNENVNHLHCWPRSLYGLGLAVGVAIFCFGLPSLIFPVFESMKNKSHIGKVICIALLIVWLCYFIVGDGLAILYINDPAGLQENMLKNLPTHSSISNTVRILMAATCLTTYPLTCVPPATMIEQLIFQNMSYWGLSGRYRYQSIFKGSTTDNDFEPTVSMRLLVRSILVLTTTIIAYVVPCFGDIIAIIGCFTVSILSFIMPPVLHLKLISYPQYMDDTSKLSSLLEYVFDFIMILSGLVLWIVGTVITVQGIYVRIRLGNSC